MRDPHLYSCTSSVREQPGTATWGYLTGSRDDEADQRRGTRGTADRLRSGR
jgi:hypothetical protein